MLGVTVVAKRLVVERRVYGCAANVAELWRLRDTALRDFMRRNIWEGEDSGAPLVDHNAAIAKLAVDEELQCVSDRGHEDYGETKHLQFCREWWEHWASRCARAPPRERTTTDGCRQVVERVATRRTGANQPYTALGESYC